MSARDVVVSGMRPTGRLHLGNYWGALKNWVELQKTYRCYFFVADWHMLTTGYDDTTKLRENTTEMVLDWLGAGLDPEKCVVFRQSDVPEHAELALMLSMITPLSWLENNPTWKEQLQELARTKESKLRDQLNGAANKAESALRTAFDLLSPLWAEEIHPAENLANFLKRYPDLKKTEFGNLITLVLEDVEIEGKKLPSEARADLDRLVSANPNLMVSAEQFRSALGEAKTRASSVRTHGFLGYPVLQAADVLIYGGTRVPVGKDQVPHIELTREIARKFNSLFGRTLAEPEPILTQTPKLPGNDGRKMSKSYGNTIELNEDPEPLKKKVMGMYTDPGRIRKDTPGHPEPCPENPPGCVVYALHKLYTPEGRWRKIGDDCRAGTLGCVDDKGNHLLPNLEKPFAEFRAARSRHDAASVGRILKDGAEKARAVARKTMAEVRAAMRVS